MRARASLYATWLAIQTPWTRMHALKDYYGMVHILEEFPKIRQTLTWCLR